MMKKYLSMAIALAGLLSLSACSQEQSKTTEANKADDMTHQATNLKSNEVITLRLSHIWPASAAMHKELFEPWANKIAEESEGRLKVEIYPSSTLSKPQSTYDATAKGVIDIGLQVQGYMNGRFPLTQIAELPGLSNSASQMSCLLQTLYDDGVISKEYEDTHVLFMIGAGPGALHTIDKPIRKPEDMKGLRIRRPSAIAGYIIEEAGGSAVGLPAPDLYSSLERGVIDGLSFAWSPTGSFRLVDLVNAHTNMPFYSSALHVTMNSEKYESLPDDLKKVIKDNSGRIMADMAGQVFDSQATKYKKEAIEKGDIMIDIPEPFNDPDWKIPLEAGTKKYLSEVEAMGLDAQGVYEKAKEASLACKS